MKDQYIRQVKKELHVPRKIKAEVVRDLEEIFAVNEAHGQTQAQVIERLGTPKEFADCAAEQFGVDPSAPRRRGRMISGALFAALAAAAFAMYAAAQFSKTPDGAIGQADAVTNIQIAGALGFDASQVLFAAGVLALALSGFQIYRAMRKNGRQL